MLLWISKPGLSILSVPSYPYGAERSALSGCRLSTLSRRLSIGSTLLVAAFQE